MGSIWLILEIKSVCSFASFTGGNSRAATLHFVDIARILHCAHSLDARRHVGQAWPVAGGRELCSITVQWAVSCCLFQRLSPSLEWCRSVSQTICSRKRAHTHQHRQICCQRRDA